MFRIDWSISRGLSSLLLDDNVTTRYTSEVNAHASLQTPVVTEGIVDGRVHLILGSTTPHPLAYFEGSRSSPAIISIRPSTFFFSQSRFTTYLPANLIIISTAWNLLSITTHCRMAHLSLIELTRPPASLNQASHRNVTLVSKQLTLDAC